MNKIRGVVFSKPSHTELVEQFCSICEEKIDLANLSKLVNNDIVDYDLRHPNLKSAQMIEAGEIIFSHRKCALDAKISKTLNKSQFLFSLTTLEKPSEKEFKNNYDICHICHEEIELVSLTKMTNTANRDLIAYDKNFQILGKIEKGQSLFCHRSCSMATQIENIINWQEAKKLAEAFLNNLSKEITTRLT